MFFDNEVDLTIITICYNEPDVFRTCESIIQQTYQNFQWIVIDALSNKKIQNIFERYKRRIDVFISEPDDGIYNAYNKGLKLAKGKYINFMNAGDSYFSPKILEVIFKKRKNLNSGIIYGNTYRVIKDLSFIYRYPEKLSVDFFIKGCLNTQSVFIKRSLFDEFGYFNEEYKICADYEKYCQFFKNNVKFMYINNVIACYYCNGISSDPKNREKLLQEKQAIFKKVFID